jgi:hypothetical protein
VHAVRRETREFYLRGTPAGHLDRYCSVVSTTIGLVPIEPGCAGASSASFAVADSMALMTWSVYAGCAACKRINSRVDGGRNRPSGGISGDRSAPKSLSRPVLLTTFVMVGNNCACLNCARRSAAERERLSG